jgi:hypothetical protein
VNSLQGARRRRLIVVGVVVATLAVVAVVTALSLGKRTPERSGEVNPGEGPAPEKITLATDCSVDVTQPLNRLISLTPDGGIVTLEPDGCYRVDGTLSLEDRQNLTIEGNGAILDGSHVPGERERRHIRVRDGSDLTFRDFTILGSRCAAPPCDGPGLAERERQHGVAVENVAGMTIERLAIMNVWGDFVYISQKGDGERSSDVIVRDSYFRNSGRQGIAPSGVAGLEVRNNVIAYAGRSVFDFEAEGGGAADVVLADNDIVLPDNATLNVGCADRETGTPLNVGPINLIGNRIYQGPLEVDTECGGQEELAEQLDVVVRDNEENLAGEPPAPPWVDLRALPGLAGTGGG